MNNKNLKAAARILLGSFLVTTGVGHLSFLRKEFRAQVPDNMLLKTDDIVVYSGIPEIVLGAALIAGGKHKKLTGRVTAAFFGLVFPGNIAQYNHHRNAFGLNTDNKRLARLLLQPVLIYWALKSTEE